MRAFARIMPGDVRSGGKNSASLVVEGNELIEYTQYSLTLDEALARQMSASPPPQTDKYRNQPAYVHSQVLSGVARQGTVAYDGVRIRTSPWLEDKYIYKTVNKGTAVVILGEVKGDPNRRHRYMVPGALRRKNAVYPQPPGKCLIIGRHCWG
ncbi:MAG: hypothetical protein ACOX3N_07290 [Dethiobacteria bacterium]